MENDSISVYAGNSEPRQGGTNREPGLGAEAKIVRHLARGQVEAAERQLFELGGLDFAFLYGYKALARIIEALPHDAYLESEVFFGLYCEHLSKQGRARRAKSMLEEGGIRFQKTHLFDLIELSVGIRLGEHLTPDKVKRWINLESHLPIDRPLSEGIYYNCMLLVFVRLNRIEEARSFGRRALDSYSRAGKPYLQFFIHQHLADLSVVTGDLKNAYRHLDAATWFLDESGVSYGSDREIMEIVRLAIDFEQGRLDHIPARAEEIRRILVRWENTAEITVQICRIGAMSLYFLKGRGAALEFLKESQVDYHRSQGEFSVALDVIQANINLLDGRVEEARHAVDEAQKQGIFSAVGQAVHESVRGKLDPTETLVVLGTGSVTLRRRVVGELIRASEAHLNRQPARVRQHVESAMRLAADQSLSEVFLEHRDVVAKVSARLATGAFARGHRQLARMARHIHQLIQASYSLPEELVGMGVTPHQMRVLTALKNGATNKQIARKLGLSEAAVKYHISKLLRAYNLSKRGELIERIETIEKSSKS